MKESQPPMGPQPNSFESSPDRELARFRTELQEQLKEIIDIEQKWTMTSDEGKKLGLLLPPTINLLDFIKLKNKVINQLQQVEAEMERREKSGEPEKLDPREGYDKEQEENKLREFIKTLDRAEVDETKQLIRKQLSIAEEEQQLILKKAKQAKDLATKEDMNALTVKLSWAIEQLKRSLEIIDEEMA